MKVPLEGVKDPKIMLENGFWKIKDLDTKGMRHTKLTYGPEKAQGLSALNSTLKREERYGAMDWDLETGKPSKKKLLELGLEDVAREFWP